MKHLIAISALIFLSACSNMQPARYAVSVDNIQALKEFRGSKVKLTHLTQSAKFDAMCRLMGPVKPADNLTISEFITKAFNDELKMAEVYSDTGIELTGDVNKIVFSSSSGYWDIGIELSSSNGESLSVNNKYKYTTSFDAITACNSTATALPAAVQDVIKSAIKHPNFINLIQAKDSVASGIAE